MCGFLCGDDTDSWTSIHSISFIDATNMLRFDDKNKRIKLSVHDVIDSGPPSGDLQLQVAWTAQTRMRMGQMVHEEYQQQAITSNPNFQKEVAVQYLMMVQGWEVEISGRIDGVVVENDIVHIVEEIKSSTLPGYLLQQKTLVDMPYWKKQVELYVHFLLSQGLTVRGELIVISIVDNTTLRLDVPMDSETAQEVENYIRSQLQWVVTEREKQIAWYNKRMQAAQDGLPFAHDKWREGQQEMSKEITKHVNNDRVMLLRASTGYGKTAASLYAALQVAYMTHRKIFFATARNTQQDMVEKTVRELQRQGVPIRALSIRSKEKSCLQETISCRPEHCPYASGYYDKVQQHDLLSDIWKTGVVHGDVLEAIGTEKMVCPYELSMNLVAGADVVIGDYNYLFDPNVQLSVIAQNKKDWIVIIDEAHNLPTRAQGYGSPFISLQKLWRALDMVQYDGVFSKFASPIQKMYDTIVQGLETGGAHETGTKTPSFVSREFQRAEPIGVIISTESMQEIADEIQSLGLEYAVKRLEHPLFGEDATDVWMESAWSILQMHNALQIAGPETVVIWQKQGTDTRRSMQQGVGLFTTESPAQHPETGMGLLCRDPSVLLQPFFDKIASAVCMSATLHPFDFYANLLGIPEERLVTAEYQSPFPIENRAAFCLPFVSTLYKDRKNAHPKIAKLLEKIIQMVSGNIAVFFSSFAVLDDIHSHMHLENREVLIQKPKMEERAKQKILRTMATGKGHVLFAVMGGVFSEGVDLPGKSLEMAIMIGPSLPMSNLSRQLMQEWYEEKYGEGFRYAWVIPGMARVSQAAGRVIRTETDRGVVVLVGNRFADPTFRNLFPSEWNLQDTSNLGMELQRFFGLSTIT